MLIHRESFRGFGPPTPLATSLCQKHRVGKVLLDNEFVLIEGHPEKQTSRGEFRIESWREFTGGGAWRVGRLVGRSRAGLWGAARRSRA
jgi:hypothetical protein